MSGRTSTFRRLYGERPLHLVVLLACFLVSAYAVSRVLGEPTAAAVRIAAWFLGAAIAFDLVLAPLAALVDRGLVALRGRGRGVSPVNYLRFPLGMSALLLLVYTPVIFRRSEGPYGAASGLDQAPYLGRWVAISVALFVLSALAYAVAVLRHRRRATADS
jgi:hypothetical protein